MASVLPAWHYASQWKVDQRFTSAEITELGRRFWAEPDGGRKQELLLELLKRFHPYLMKYVLMISRGRMPENSSRPDSDTHQFLRVYLRPGEAATPVNLAKVCRRLHLAFKGMDTSEIYDVLVSLMTEAIARWEPDYNEKIRLVIEAAGRLMEAGGGEVCYEQILEAVGFDPLRYCQRLAGYRILEPAGKGRSRIWKPGPAWPPRPEFLESGTIGLTYVAIRWFRWLLQRYITRRMNELEHANDILQLGVRRMSSENTVYTDEIIPHAQGELVSFRTSRRWSADMSLANRAFDLSSLSLEWVEQCSDPLFRGLTRLERFVLYGAYTLGLSWHELGQAAGLKTEEARSLHDGLLVRIRSLAGAE